MQNILTASQYKEVEAELLEGVARRASLLSFLSSIIVTLFGFTSIYFIRQFNPGATLIGNVLSRFLINSVPLILMGLVIKNNKKYPKMNQWIWVFAWPIIFVSACCINVWPIIYSGSSEIYFYVQTANSAAFFLSFVFVGVSPKVILINFIWLLIVFHFPVGYMLWKNQNYTIFHLYLSDMFIFQPMMLICSNISYQLRFSIAQRDIQIRDHQNKEILFRDQEIKKKTKEVLNLLVAASLGELATQIAHDIQSPLAALRSISNQVLELSEENRIIIHAVIIRINDIANSLINKHKQNTLAVSKTNEETESLSTEPALLYSLIDEVITEKRFQYQSLRGISIHFAIKNDRHTLLFAQVDQVEFKKIISNLLNNAHEAIEESGQIKVDIRLISQEVLITITDTGRGIAPDIIAKLGIRGGTYGKKSGLGLGLFHARNQIQSWGGRIQIESQLNQGTSVKIYLQNAKLPDFFAHTLFLRPESRIIILDDDRCIHQLWDKRLKLSSLNLKIFHFYSPKKLKSWLSSNLARENFVFLVDYLFQQDIINGIDIIQSSGIIRQSFLVTSHYQDTEVQLKSKSLGIKIIPKNIILFISIFELTKKDDRTFSLKK